ncbi:hypothetical protein E8E14_006401 [Neopestalotiopsis sp. 37M]|nr:hypothetical protein E8E14_006401 [Neopestalotiopsis sp. 37M]
METYSDPPVSSSDSYEPNGGGIMSATTPIMMPSNYDDNDQSLSQPYYQNMYHQPVQQYFPMPEMMPQSLYQDGTQNYINSPYPRNHDTTTWVQTNQMVMPFSSAPYEFGMPYATTNQDFLYCAQNP